ncbi:hypothetical protein AB0A87_14000, partial [Streptomyces sp. NPDC045251]
MTSEPRPAPFRVPDRLFAELAAGGGSAEAVAFLERGERARRLLLLRTLLDRLAPLPTPLTPVAEAWEVFKAAAERAPEAVDGLLLAPTTGGWIAHMLRRVHGTATGPPLWAEAGRLNVLAVTAALRAGAETELTVPLADGGLHLPGLGLLRVPDAPPGPTVARATTRTGELTLTGPPDHAPRPSATCHPKTAPAKHPPTSPPAAPDIADGAARDCPPEPSTGTGGSRGCSGTGSSGVSGVGPPGAAPYGPEDPGGLRVAGSSVPPPVGGGGSGGAPAARPSGSPPAGPDGPQDSSRTRPTAPASTTEDSSTGAASSASGTTPSASGTASPVPGTTAPAIGAASPVPGATAPASGTASPVSGTTASASGAASPV